MFAAAEKTSQKLATGSLPARRHVSEPHEHLALGNELERLPLSRKASVLVLKTIARSFFSANAEYQFGERKDAIRGNGVRGRAARIGAWPQLRLLVVMTG